MTMTERMSLLCLEYEFFSFSPSKCTSLGPNRRLRSILQCVTCQMISKAADSDVQNMAQAVADNPQWLSKMQVSVISDTYLIYNH